MFLLNYRLHVSLLKWKCRTIFAFHPHILSPLNYSKPQMIEGLSGRGRRSFEKKLLTTTLKQIAHINQTSII